MGISVESIYRRRVLGTALAFVASVVALPAVAASSMPIAPDKIDRTVERAMREFKVPGMAVGIVKDGKLIYAKGYGVREAGKPGRIDPDTLFQIGSNTKAFTSAALAILVDEGKLHWEDKVIDHLPQFRLYDPYVTREFTISDLLTHRSGLGPGAGDLMFYPATDFTRAEIIHGLRYLKPASSFRAKFDYDNVLYLVAGEIIPAVTGKSWEDFVRERIFVPLHMQACAVNYDSIEDRSDVATPHVEMEGKLTVIPVENLNTVGAAGSINCSINGMANWLQTHLGAGRAPNGQQLFSAARGSEMWTINSVTPVDPEVAALTGTNFSGYGLGWGLQDSFGRKRVSHTGGVPGSVTLVSMIPELNLGVLVFTNQQSGGAIQAVGNQILDAYLGAPKRDWIDVLVARTQKRLAAAKAVEAEAAKVAESAGQPTLPLDAYAGRYNDSWRGDANVRIDGDKLVLKISRTEGLEGPLTPYSGNIFIVRWNNRGLDADAYVRFEQGFDGKIQGMTMRAVSPATDFSFDFQDLDFRRVEASAASE
jgi:CubicO group peptidase (beta-lactamase class C family)